MLDLERKLFDEKKSEWLAAYEGRFVLVHEKDLVGVYNSQEEAISVGVGQFGLVPFLVRQVEATDSEVVIPVLMLGLLGADPKLSNIRAA